MGSTVLFSDNFQQVDPAWNMFSQGTLDISGGYAQVTPPAGDSAYAVYDGGFFDSADACVDIVSPTVADPTQAVAGLVIGMDPSGSFYACQIGEDGTAAVARYSSAGDGAWALPVSWRPAPAVKTGANALNTLRITWKGNSGTCYINGQLFSAFVIPQAFVNSAIGFSVGGDSPGATAGATWKFTNLKITNAP